VQRQSDSGRTAEILAVQQFLGSVHVDHFVEATLVAFYELAKVVLVTSCGAMVAALGGLTAWC